MGALDNARQEQQDRRRRGGTLVDLERALRYTDRACGTDQVDDVWIREIRVRVQTNGVQVVVKGIDGAGGPVVAFVGGGTYCEGLAALERALGADGLRWRADKPFDERAGKTVRRGEG